MYDVIIIGAGPAGLSAAITTRKLGLYVLVLDEFPIPGGRLLGQLHEEADGTWWNGIEETEKLVQAAKKLDTEIMCNISVHHLEKLEETFIVHTNHKVFHAHNILIATGAAEAALPIPGWTLPGVMSIGAAQVMTNIHRVKIGNQGVIVGINVLSAAIARELQLAGLHIHSLVLPLKNEITFDHAHPKQVMENLSRIAHLAPSKFIRLGSKLIQYKFVQQLVVHHYPKKGINMWDMPVHLRKAIISINGTNEVESVTLCKISPEGELEQGTEEIVEADFVCIAGGLYPLGELAAVIGCPFHYVEELGGHVPVHNEKMETPIKGLFVAGNITGIENAQVAMAQGTVAGWSIARHTITERLNIDGKIQEAVDEVAKLRSEASIRFHEQIDQGRKQIEKEFSHYLKGK